MKTDLTLEMEKSLYFYCMELGGIVVEEVTMPEEHGIVDTLACFFKENKMEWRCYELKVSKADFMSAAKLSFVGDYNYFVLPTELYEKVQGLIPAEIGVLVYRRYDQFQEEQMAPGTFILAKKPQKQSLKVPEDLLLERFMFSLFREVRKAKQMSYGTSFFPTEALYKELKKRGQEKDHLHSENFHDRFFSDVENARIKSLEEELTALEQDYQFLKSQRKVKRRPTERLE
ncbi:hypothetical protein [Enterococcus alishanensis]|uniref:Uncharacterized protein n=1 Tax=Enterococcus alishanensis TaxID=1303817 RepID=A0ABS6TBH1_9ENTE|nr:hypothetical protein [Enterococcus alishanensis]MBV7390252.1 hypothetical protein [Enterococcus alishanensis]